MGSPACTQTADPINPDEVASLQALGYLEAVEGLAPGTRLGVTRYDAERAAAGLTYFSSAGECSGHLMDMEGDLVHSWRHEPCDHWENSVLLPNGHVFALHKYPSEEPISEYARDALSLVTLDEESRLLWEVRDGYHHDVELLPDGRIAALRLRHRIIPAVEAKVPIRDHFLVLLEPGGNVLVEQSITELLVEAEGFKFKKVKPRLKEWLWEIDLLHSNTVEWMRRPHLAQRDRIYSLDNVLLCVRNQDTVVIVDWSSRSVVWQWGQGVLSHPHDATVLDSGHILVFDNGVDKKRSRVVELDPLTKQVVWKYEPIGTTKFYTKSRGASQKLENGNVLVAVSNSGEIREVTRDGKIVWQYRNQRLNEKRQPHVIVRARRYVPTSGSFLPSARID